MQTLAYTNHSKLEPCMQTHSICRPQHGLVTNCGRRHGHNYNHPIDPSCWCAGQQYVGVHPNPRAPRCLPCAYADPLLGHYHNPLSFNTTPVSLACTSWLDMCNVNQSRSQSSSPFPLLFIGLSSWEAWVNHKPRFESRTVLKLLVFLQYLCYLPYNPIFPVLCNSTSQGEEGSYMFNSCRTYLFYALALSASVHCMQMLALSPS